MAKSTPDTTSSDYQAMAPYWGMVETLLGGTAAMRVAGQTYLPQFPNESAADYQYRLDNSKFTNIYADIIGTLSSKPFGEKLTIDDKAPDAIKALVEDIDGRGNNLHVFSEAAFTAGLNNAVDWILVDYTRARLRADGRPLSIADERAQGLRPYWVRIPATRMLAVYTDVIKGIETFVHARILETTKQRSGFDETTIERVRVLNREPIFALTPDGVETDQVIDYAPATFQVWEKRTSSTGRRGTAWDLVDSGPITIGVIALVPFLTGDRVGSSWRIIPPLEGAAYMQVEHYQQETALKSIRELTAFPMLAGNGVTPATGADGKPLPVPVGPKSVLYAPSQGDSNSHGEWTFIEPSAASLKFLSDDIKRTEDQMRELGRQPMIASTGITVVAAAYASQKASSVLKSWAMGLKDALEQALRFTAMWLGVSEPLSVSWNLDDLDLDMQDDDGMTDVQAARENGDLSQETLWSELKRRGKLSPDFDADQERKRIENEMPGDDEADDLTGALPPEPDLEIAA